MKSFARLASALIAAFAFFSVSFAQEAPSGVNLDRLESLYSQINQNPGNEYLQKLIDNELADLSKEADQEIVAIIAKITEATPDSTESKLTPVERQRAVTGKLGELLRENEADLGLLRSEEKTFYGTDENPVIVTGAIAGIARTTENHAQLQARKTWLDIKVRSLESAENLQQARLSTLQRQQFLDQFSVWVMIAKFALFIVVARLLERAIRKRLSSRIADDARRYRITKGFTTVYYTIAIVWVIAVAVANNPGVLASLAIIGAGLAIAMQDIVKDVIAWMMIVQNQLFGRGDRITINNICGEVVDYGPLRTTLLEVGVPQPGDTPIEALERTGKLISIPNIQFLTGALTNHSATSNYIRSEMKLTLTFESAHDKAREILQRILNAHTEQYLDADLQQTRSRGKNLYFIPHRTMGNQIYLALAADGVEFTLRFTIPIGERRGVVSAMTADILKAFSAEKDIALAYSTIRVYQRDTLS